MYKVRKIKFIDHPVLKNMEFDFTGRNGEAVANLKNEIERIKKVFE
jgi:hypothetical protein